MTHRQIKKVLVANRGEIAVRVMRTCREQGIPTVAVFSKADSAAFHVRMADEAYEIGPAASAESYLRQDRILEVARNSGADALHPGYGFLAENAGFAEACADAGVTFIGPPPAAIRAMGDKTAARAMMKKAGVPLTPGTTDPVTDLDEARRVAADIGYPLLVKAAAGGGGKGMRVVRSESEMEYALSAAQSEAKSAFGDGRVFIEKFVERPRHIEFQILADHHGNAVHLFERECSIQRRHQKVIEEAPSVVMTDELRERMGSAAVTAALSCGYTNAGTVEFLLAPNGEFYFMEMNTRLQVEHPVTEWITGIDLVLEQLRIAEGEALTLSQSDLAIRGHAIECRIYAEDPENNFLPDPGRLFRHAPPGGFGVRVDAGVEEGDNVEIFYDPMISKLTAWAGDRPTAIRRMLRALDEYHIGGVKTTIPFCCFVLEDETFRSGDISTNFVEDRYRPEALAEVSELQKLIAAVGAVVTNGADQEPSTSHIDDHPRPASKWADRRRY